MTTTTRTQTQIVTRGADPRMSTFDDQQAVVSYPDPDHSVSTINYYRDASLPPPDAANSGLSTHEIRVARRSDDGPNVEKKTVRIRNIRGREHEFGIDDQGFSVERLRSSMHDWSDEDELKRVYFPEVSQLLKRVTGARHVFQYEHMVRTRTLEEALATDSEGHVDIMGPVRRVHIDESPASARNEFRYYVRPDAPGNEHLRGRPFAIFNVWKPLRTVRRDPLCMCDSRTFADAELQGGKVTVLNVGEIENFALRPPRQEGGHDFVYLRGQLPDEALVFRVFDSRLDGGVDGGDVVEDGRRSHGVPHTSFVDPGTEDQLPRESAEVRSFCVF